MEEYKITKAVITGATGLNGATLVEKLADEGVEVFAVCRSGSTRMENIIKRDNVHIVECNMENYSDLPNLIPNGADVFFHLAWEGTASNDNRFAMHLQTDNVRYTLDAAEAAKKLGCHTFIGTGSQAEYGRVTEPLSPDTPTFPISGYGAAKLCAGQMTRIMCQEHGIRHIWVRIVSTYGKYDVKKTLISTLIDDLKEGQNPPLTKGEQEWDYLYVEDAANALWHMAKFGKDGAIYVLGSGKTMPLRKYMEIVRDIISPETKLRIGEKPYYKDQAMYLSADISTLTKDTGWTPKFSFEEGIRKILNER